MAAAQKEASRWQALATRHQEAVAGVTADNVVFLMRLQRCEAELAAATAARDELRLAADEQRGPWFDEVPPAPLSAFLLPSGTDPRLISKTDVRKGVEELCRNQFQVVIIESHPASRSLLPACHFMVYVRRGWNEHGQQVGSCKGLMLDAREHDWQSRSAEACKHGTSTPWYWTRLDRNWG